MWCTSCRQDVPGIASTDEGRPCCIRCGSVLAANSGHVDHGSHEARGDDHQPGTSQAAAPVPPEPPVDLDGWDLDEDLQDAERLLGRLQGTGRKAGGKSVSTTYRLDASHAAPTGRHQRSAAAAPRETAAAGSKRRPSWAAWTMLCLGLMAFVCGAVLLGWSFVAQRSDLWNLGLPLTLGGQVGLLFGLVLQLERLWQNSRHAADKLDAVDEQLGDLKRTTAMLGTTHSSAAVAFYSHMAEGANPQLLLADLKGQLDLLAIKLSREN